MTRIVYDGAPPPMTHVYHRPPTPSWFTDHEVVPEYGRRLAAIGLTDPTTATERFASAVELREAAATASPMASAFV